PSPPGGCEGSTAPQRGPVMRCTALAIISSPRGRKEHITAPAEGRSIVRSPKGAGGSGGGRSDRKINGEGKRATPPQECNEGRGAALVAVASPARSGFSPSPPSSVRQLRSGFCFAS